MSAVERRDQIGLYEMSAASHVDDISALGQGREQPGVQDMARLRCQGQHANEIIALLQEGIELALTGEARDTVDRFLRAAPAGDNKTEIAQTPRGDRADLAQSQDSDPRVLRP